MENPSAIESVLMAYIEKRAGRQFTRIPLCQMGQHCHRSERMVGLYLSRLEASGLLERQIPGQHSHKLGCRLTAAGRAHLAAMFMSPHRQNYEGALVPSASHRHGGAA